jgi:phosphoglycolate phosphatase
MKFKAVIFDLDGTLLDTITDLANSMNEVLKRNGFPIHDIERYKYYVGDGVDQLVTRALPKNMIDDNIVSKITKEYREEYSNRWAEKTKPYNGIYELLDGLVELGLRINVLSNKPDETTKIVIKKFLSKWNFEIVAGAQKDVPEKPDPAGAIILAKKLGLNPDEILYVGDTNTDMKTANGAGMFAVGALWGFRTADELLENGAKVLVKYPTDIFDLVK